MNKINILYNNDIYIIDKDPYETFEETYERGWFIIKNYNNYDYDELVSQSIIALNIKKGMEYQQFFLKRKAIKTANIVVIKFIKTIPIIKGIM